MALLANAADLNSSTTGKWLGNQIRVSWELKAISQMILALAETLEAHR